MSVYMVPPDINEKEKIIGGLFDLNQFLWLLGGFILGIVVFLSTYFFLGKFALFLGGIFVLTGTPFVFIKIKDLTLFEYIKRKHLFNKKNKKILYNRKNQIWE